MNRKTKLHFGLGGWKTISLIGKCDTTGNSRLAGGITTAINLSSAFVPA
jgi:hypothetical protein